MPEHETRFPISDTIRKAFAFSRTATYRSGWLPSGLWYVNRFAITSREGREQSLALTKLQEAVMWANAGIAING